jgi:hypothetical protein
VPPGCRPEAHRQPRRLTSRLQVVRPDRGRTPTGSPPTAGCVAGSWTVAPWVPWPTPRRCPAAQCPGPPESHVESFDVCRR